MICIQIYLSEWLMRHVLETYKVFEQGKLLDAVIHIVINFLHAGQFVRFSLILCQLYFSIFRKISPWPHHSQALHIHQSCQGLEGVVIWLFDWFSSARHSARHVSIELRCFSLACTRNVGHICVHLAYCNAPARPSFNGQIRLQLCQRAQWVCIQLVCKQL